MAANTEDQAKIKLYWLNSSRSQRILWLLEELKLPYELEIFHRNKETLLAPQELEKIHPLGKSPVISVTPPGPDAKPIVLAESGFITEFLCDHSPEGHRLVPNKWRDGMEGKMGGETESWLRYRYYMHYCEGSLMPVLVMALVISRLKSNQVPFFIRPLTSSVADRIFSALIFPNMKKHMAMLDEQLATAPDGGGYLCGSTLTAADILMSFPLIRGKERIDEMGRWEGGSWKKAHPRVWEYVQRLEAEDGYKKSVEKIKEIEGTFADSMNV